MRPTKEMLELRAKIVGQQESGGDGARETKKSVGITAFIHCRKGR